VSTDAEPELSVCTVVRDPTTLPSLLGALAQQSAGPETFELVIMDATPDGLGPADHPDVDVVLRRSSPGEGDAGLLDQAWRAARAPGIVFLAAHLAPAPRWVEAMQRQLRRGRRVVVGSWLPEPDGVGQSGVLSQHLWTAPEESGVATTDQLACLAADLGRVGGVPDLDDPVARGVTLAARLVDAGADPSWARHAVVYHPIDGAGLAPALGERRRRIAASLAVLVEHPRARARLLPAGVFPHRRTIEVLLAALGLLTCARDRRSLLLALPWLHERTCLTPRAGGERRRWFVLPGVLAVDLHDAVAGLATRLAPRQPPG
jgi:hypothetical protein